MNTPVVFYMHTSDGKPGYFDGAQIVFAEQREHWCDEYHLVTLVPSEDQIKVERQKSIRYRRRHGWDVPKYDHVAVSTDRGTIPPKEKS